MAYVKRDWEPGGTFNPISNTVIASNDCIRRLQNFANGLEQLCRKYDVRLYAADDLGKQEHADIHIEDRQRPRDEDWPAVAFFNGVDEDGLYNKMNLGKIRRRGICFAEKEED